MFNLTANHANNRYLTGRGTTTTERNDSMRSIMRHPRFSFFVLVAALQLITFWLAILTNELTLAHISNVLLSAVTVCLAYEVDSLRLDRKKNPPP